MEMNGNTGRKRAGRGRSARSNPSSRQQIDGGFQGQHSKAANSSLVPYPELPENNFRTIERVRGRPRGHNRTPLTREEQLKRNALYERERRALLGNGWNQLSAAMESNAPQNKLLAEAPSFIKRMERKMFHLADERERELRRNAFLQEKLAALQAASAAEVKLDSVEMDPEMPVEPAPVMLEPVEVDPSEVLIDGEFDIDDAVYIVLPMEEGNENAVVDVRPDHCAVEDIPLPPEEIAVANGAVNSYRGDIDVADIPLPPEDIADAYGAVYSCRGDFDTDELELPSAVCDAIDIRPNEIDVIGLMCAADGGTTKVASEHTASNANVTEAVKDNEGDSGVHSPEVKELLLLSQEEEAYLNSRIQIGPISKKEIPQVVQIVDASGSSVPPTASPNLQPENCLSYHDILDLAVEMLEEYSNESGT